MATFKKFEDIEAWQLARQLSKEICLETRSGTFEKDYKLCDQVNAASGSVMNNIAEGFGRGGRIEFVNFLSFASGSCDEVQSQLYQALDRKHISEERFEYFYRKAKEVSGKINNLIIYLNKSSIKGTKFKDRA